MNALPLQPTHGNRLPHPPAPTPPLVPVSVASARCRTDSNPRQSGRNKRNIQSTSVDDGLGMTAQEDVATSATERQRMVGSQTTEEDIFDVPRGALEDGEPFSRRESMPDGGRLAGKMGRLLSGSPSEGLISVDRRERMMFMEPRITFRTLTDMNKSGQLIGKLQKLWRQLNRHERKVIPDICVFFFSILLPIYCHTLIINYSLSAIPPFHLSDYRIGKMP